MGLVDDDQPIHVLVHQKHAPATATRKLPIIGQLLIGDHRGGQVRLGQAPLPQTVPQLRRRYHQYVMPQILGVLADELDPNLGLPHANPVRVQNPTISIQNALCPGEPMPLEGRKVVPASGLLVLLEFVPV